MSAFCSWRSTLRSIRPRSRSLQLCSFSSRHSSDISQLRNELMARRFPLTIDYVTPVPATLLRQTLRNYISYPYKGDAVPESVDLALGHHLVYFPNPASLSSLHPDGTDPSHSPGPPYSRRMWAGGSMMAMKSIEADSSGYTVQEKIVDVQGKGEDSDEKIFVTIRRAVHRGINKTASQPTRERHASVIETRTLVFMQERSPTVSGSSGQSPSKILKPTMVPDFSITMVPTPALLFRFSALTFNAHAIHLDNKYCQEVEGHRNLLVHGPLTAILMLDVLRSFLHNERIMGRGSEHIESIEYRNLAPLYAEEMMKVCLKRRNRAMNTGSFDVWVEGKDGGYAVKGLVQTSSFRPQFKYHQAKRPPLSRESKNTTKRSVDRDDTSVMGSASNGGFADFLATLSQRKEAESNNITTDDDTVSEEGDALEKASSKDPTSSF